MKHVVAIERKGYRYPKLTVVVLAQVASVTAGRRYITDLIMSTFDKVSRGRRMRQYPRMSIKDYRVVDEKGLRRLRAAAKASITLARRRAAKKAAATRKRNRELGIAPKRRPYPYVF
jgi:hypothetical protein